jgi:hypothetical protein
LILGAFFGFCTLSNYFQSLNELPASAFCLMDGGKVRKVILMKNRSRQGQQKPWLQKLELIRRSC